jgi:hypothetical protein
MYSTNCARWVIGVSATWLRLDKGWLAQFSGQNDVGLVGSHRKIGTIASQLHTIVAAKRLLYSTNRAAQSTKQMPGTTGLRERPAIGVVMLRALFGGLEPALC